MKIKLIILSTVAMLTFSSLSYSQVVAPTDSKTQEIKRRKHYGNRGNGLKQLHKLNLSDDQKAKIKTIKETFRAKSTPNREEMKSLMSKKRDGILTAEEETQFTNMRSQMREVSKQIQTDIENVLTDEQRTQFLQMRSEIKIQRKNRNSLSPKPPKN
jgi:Spy/CpxP family protein refolding chaperone